MTIDERRAILKKLSKQQLIEAIEDVHDWLFLDEDDDEKPYINFEKEWDCVDVAGGIAGVMQEKCGLEPDDDIG